MRGLVSNPAPILSPYFVQRAHRLAQPGHQRREGDLGDVPSCDDDEVIASRQARGPDGLAEPSLRSITYHCASYSSPRYKSKPGNLCLTYRSYHHQVTDPPATARRQDGAETGRRAE